jgi:hypothetical protein
MRGARVYPWVVALVALAGCGSPDRPSLAPPATPRTVELGWHEPFTAGQFVFEVERLVVEEDGWRAKVKVRNESTSPYRFGGRRVALVLLETSSRDELTRLTDNLERAPPSLLPDRVAPRPPAVLGPGASWSGELRGSTVLGEGSVVRVLFGPFSRIGARGRESSDVLWVTDHSVRL